MIGITSLGGNWLDCPLRPLCWPGPNLGIWPFLRGGGAAWDDAHMETTRVDRWLWAVRVHKTRALATDGCRAGHVTVNGTQAKAATMVKPGDRVVARVGSRQRDLEVVTVIEKRVSAAVAATCVIDHTPPPPEPSAFDQPVFKRDARTGRPTKRDRRDLERLRREQDL